MYISALQMESPFFCQGFLPNVESATPLKGLNQSAKWKKTDTLVQDMAWDTPPQ